MLFVCLVYFLSFAVCYVFSFSFQVWYGTLIKHQKIDLLVVLVAQGALVLNLGSQRGQLLLPALQRAAQLSDGALQVRDCLLGQLQVTLHLEIGES